MENLRKLRKAKGLKQKELAAAPKYPEIIKNGGFGVFFRVKNIYAAIP